jgi:hypothetical protein
MSRIGYAILVLVVLGLAIYAFRPERSAHTEVLPVHAGAPPADFTVRNQGLEQAVSGDRVRIQGMVVPLDQEKSARLWEFIASLGAVPGRVLAGVDAVKARDFGIDGTRELVCAGLRLGWGSAGDAAYLWEGVSQRVFVAEAGTLKRLDQLTQRLDRFQLLTFDQSTRYLEVNGLALELRAGEWLDPLRPQRPPFSRRVRQLAKRLENLRLADFTSRPPPSVAGLDTVRLGAGNPLIDPAASALVRDRVLRLWRQGEGGVFQIDDLPAQDLAPAELAALVECLESFSRDYLFDLEGPFRANPLQELVVKRGGGEFFRLEKHGQLDVDRESQRSQWDVIWPGGREVAIAECASMIADAFDNLPVEDPQPRAAVPPPGADATVFDFIFANIERHWRIELSGRQVWSATHRGTLQELPRVLAQLGPDLMLDTALVNRPAQRVVKIQRQIRDQEPARAEVFTASDGGRWRQTYPAAAQALPVNQLAVDRIARALCAARGREARLITAADRAVLAAPVCEIDLRFAPQPVRHSNDYTRLDDTTDLDLGLAFAPEGDLWRAVSKEGAVSFLIDAELMELIRQRVQDDQVFPLVPSLVRSLEVASPTLHYLLALDDRGWTVQSIGRGGQAGEVRRADEVQVRRYLRLLSGLRALRTIATDAEAPLADATTITCTLPTEGASSDQMILSVGRATEGEAAWRADATRDARKLPGGRGYLTAESAAALVPDPASFLRADQAP